MTCSACSARVEKAVTALAGTEQVSVNLLTNSMQLSYDEGKLTPAQIIAAVEQAGYGASLQGEKSAKAAEPGEDSLVKEAANMRKRLIWSAAFLLPLMYIAMHNMIYAWLGLPVPDVMQMLFDGLSDKDVDDAYRILSKIEENLINMEAK